MEFFGMFWSNWRIYFSEEATRGLLDTGFCPNAIDVFNRFQSQCSFHLPLCSYMFRKILCHTLVQEEGKNIIYTCASIVGNKS